MPTSPTYEAAMRAPVVPRREITAQSIADNYASLTGDYNDYAEEWVRIDAISAEKEAEAQKQREQINGTVIIVTPPSPQFAAVAARPDRPDVDVSPTMS